jgi:hypothetical protein
MGHWLETTSIIGRTCAQKACSQINTAQTAVFITAEIGSLATEDAKHRGQINDSYTVLYCKVLNRELTTQSVVQY